MNLQQLTPNLLTADILGTVTFYTEILGFEMDFLAAVGGENAGKVESPKIRYGHEGRGR